MEAIDPDSRTDRHRLGHRIVLERGPEAPARARAQVLARTGRIARADDLALLVSEAVTNAVRHGGSGPRDPVVVHVSHGCEAVAVRVCDGGDGVPRRRRSGHDGGFGLQLVDLLAESWGVGPGELWFSLRLR
jgi:anti-sigma regulatory factor (Ser/Thr protein kinase)